MYIIFKIHYYLTKRNWLWLLTNLEAQFTKAWQNMDNWWPFKIVNSLGLDIPLAWKAVGLNKPSYINSCFFSYCSLSQFERDNIFFWYYISKTSNLWDLYAVNPMLLSFPPEFMKLSLRKLQHAKFAFKNTSTFIYMYMHNWNLTTYFSS